MSNNSVAKIFDKVKFFDKVKILPANISITPSPTYSLSRSSASVDEGSSITFTLTTTGVANGTSVPYSISGISANDLSSGSLSGNFVVNSGFATITLITAIDLITEGSETITITTVDQSSNAAINDTSLTPTYTLNRSVASVNEGSSVTFTLTTTGVANGTLVPYTITGISASDLSFGSLTGNFVVNNGSATITLTAANDSLTEGSETITITVGGQTASAVINDTSVAGPIWTQRGQDIDGEAVGDNFGWSVSVNSAGDVVAIGAINNNGVGASGQMADSGSVRVYDWNGSSWVKRGQDIDGESSLDQFGYSVSVNSSGDRVAIGAPYNDAGGSNSGSVRVYSWNGTSWVKLGQDIDGEAADDNSGWSVSMNDVGDRVAIGAPENNSGGGSSGGQVRVYSWNGISWVKLGQDIDGEWGSERFGHSVSMNSDGSKIAVGSPHHYHSVSIGSQAGRVKVYSWNGTTWIKVGQDINGEAAGDKSGWSVSINAVGDKVAIGAPFNSPGGQHFGQVRVYSWNGTSWIKQGQDIDGESYYDKSGWSVSMNDLGDKVAIGAPANTPNAAKTNAGHARVYSWNGTYWVKQGQDIDGESSLDNSGQSVSLNASGDIVAVGANLNNGNLGGADQGHARVYGSQ